MCYDLAGWISRGMGPAAQQWEGLVFRLIVNNAVGGIEIDALSLNERVAASVGQQKRQYLLAGDLSSAVLGNRLIMRRM